MSNYNNIQTLRSPDKDPIINSHKLHEKIITVSELLSEPSLHIPEYQRPYKWTKSNIASLFSDIKTQCDKPAYRLGTIVLHQPHDKLGTAEDVLHIVDGQQRTLTLALIVLAITKYYKKDKQDKQEFSAEAKAVNEALDKLPGKVQAFANNQEFPSDISIYNLNKNYQDIYRIISRGELTVKHIKFLLHKCEVVVFVLKDESEAFQFFDSQNSRGKSLYPHDLLKAFHLREFSAYDEKLDLNIKAKTVAYWENLNDDNLNELFGKHLFRIKRWSHKKPARTFTSSHIDTFKGISLNNESLPPHAKTMLITHHFIDDYNSSRDRQIDGHTMSYPFQLDQTIINGRRFFEMVEHYHLLVEQKDNILLDKTTITQPHDTGLSVGLSLSSHSRLNERASTILHTLKTYKNRSRQGDKYNRNLFDNALLYYIDKFGTQNLSQVIEIVFIWAYSIRLKQHAVKLATMDNHAIDTSLFKNFKESTLPKDILMTSMSPLKESDLNTSNKNSNQKNIEIYKLFAALNYLDKN